MNKKIYLASILCLFLFFGFIFGVNSVLAHEIGPKITFTFDDGNSRIYTNAAPILAKYNMPAVLYGETGPLNSGEDWVMTWDQIRELRDKHGWEIGSHTINHPYLTKVSNKVLIKELLGAKQDFADEGIMATSFATPYGDYNNKVLSYIARYYEAHRAAWGGPNVWPDIYNDYELVSMEASNTTSPEEVEGWIDEAIKNKEWLVILMHDIVDGVPQAYEYNINDLEKIVAYTASRPIEATTITEGLKYTDQPNLIKNFTFSDLDSSGWALDWTRTNSARVTIDKKGHGNVYGFENSLKIHGGAAQYEAHTGVIAVNPATDYMLRMYQNVQNLKSGGWAVWVDEFDANNNWTGGQWLGGNYANFVGDRYYEYQPTSSNVKKIQIYIFTEENSDLTLYVDSVFFNALSAVEDTIRPVITLLGDSTMDLTVGDIYDEPGATAMDNVDGDISGSITIGGDIVNTTATGTYYVTYNVSDAAGNNAAELTRIVNVMESVLSNNAKLSDLKLDGITVSGFSPDIFVYSFESPAGSVITPIVTANPEDAGAEVIITQADSLPGQALVKVTAKNQIAVNTYIVNFTLANPADSLVPNFSFEDLSSGWADNWTRLDANITIDTNNMGYGQYPKNSLKITAGNNQRVAISSIINIDAAKNYELSFYQKIDNFTSGGAAVWVDEFNANNSWVSGSWLGGNYGPYNGVKRLNYTPTSNQVAKIQVHLFTERNSQLTLYIDSVILQTK